MDKVMRVEIFHVTENPNSNITYINTETRFMPPDDPAKVKKTVTQGSVYKNGFYINKKDRFKVPVFKFTLTDVESEMKYRNEPENQNQNQNQENDLEN